jgi:hypothetical protein
MRVGAWRGGQAERASCGARDGCEEGNGRPLPLSLAHAGCKRHGPAEATSESTMKTTRGGNPPDGPARWWVVNVPPLPCVGCSGCVRSWHVPPAWQDGPLPSSEPRVLRIGTARAHWPYAHHALCPGARLSSAPARSPRAALPPNSDPPSCLPPTLPPKAMCTEFSGGRERVAQVHPSRLGHRARLPLSSRQHLIETGGRAWVWEGARDRLRRGGLGAV